MTPPFNEPPADDAMFEQFLQGDEELAAALADAESTRENAGAREQNVLTAGLQFVRHLRDMGEERE